MRRRDGLLTLQLAGAGIALLGGYAVAQETGDAARLPALEVEGIVPQDLAHVPGSTFVIDERTLEEARPFSVQEALRLSPGVHAVHEDPLGLNLNIGIRGLEPRRTQRLNLLEDGAPIHLAPYSDPSAHYHPPMERVQRVEILKGSGQIVHGPQTIGGVLNFVTLPAPTGTTGRVRLSGGNRDFAGAHVGLGTGADWGGVRLDYVHKQGEGKREHYSHKVDDFSAKGTLAIGAHQSLTLKGGWFQEDSRTGEAGITQQQFETDPFANPFRDDVFELERTAGQALHRWSISERATLTTNLYAQRIDRASFRQIDEATDQMTAVPETGCVGEARTDYENFAPLCGNKMRPREFRFWGIEPRLDLMHTAFGVPGEAVIGVRAHFEDQTRRRYNGLRPNARPGDPDALLRDWNEIDVDAYAAYLQNTFFLGEWTVTPGLRYEHFRLRNRALQSGFEPIDVTLTDTHRKALPGLGFTYEGLANTTIFGGVHTGLAPPRPDRDLSPVDPAFVPVSPEESTNYELGLRTRVRPGVQAEVTWFGIDFDNQIVRGEQVGLPQTFANAGESRHRGVELAGRVDFGALLRTPHNVYATAAYTNLYQARFASDLIVEGVNVRGNRLPHAPRHMLSAGLGYEHARGLDVRVGLHHVSRQYSDSLNLEDPTPDGERGPIPSYTIYEAAINYRLPRQGVTLFLSGTNLSDRVYIAQRVDGIQVGTPRQIMGGLIWDF
jgi:Fe(3+) dicitrate transport protein